ncbi:LysR substrate binding domain protein [compost metagenome]
MIDAGNGITFLPRSMAQNNARRTRTTVQVQDLDASRRYGSVVRSKAELSAAAQNFRAYLRQHFRGRLEALG